MPALEHGIFNWHDSSHRAISHHGEYHVADVGEGAVEELSARGGVSSNGIWKARLCLMRQDRGRSVGFANADEGSFSPCRTDRRFLQYSPPACRSIRRLFCSKPARLWLPGNFFIILTRSLSTRFGHKMDDNFKRHDRNSMTRWVMA